MPKSRKTKQQPRPTKYSFIGLLVLIVERIFDAFRDGHAYPAITMAVLGLLAWVAYLMPDEALGETVIFVVHQAAGSWGGLVLLLISTNLGWAYIHARRKRLDGEEIDRLTEQRKELLHGGGSDALIREHRTSETSDAEEHYALPGDKPDEEPAG